MNPPGRTYCQDCGRRVAKYPSRQSPSSGTTAAQTATSGPTVQGAKVKTICFGGESINLTSHLVSGGITVFDFYADWCGPCKSLGPVLEKYVQSTPDVFLRKINIKEWGSPVAEKYGIRSVPSIWIYGRKGQVVAQGINGMGSVQQALQQALQ
ncbi:MAG: thioredoxin family protein [Candidatus Omnitrophica bacterium]|nr:thioredoxin family protein [Candidatus Omnitrophota bacterium]